MKQGNDPIAARLGQALLAAWVVLAPQAPAPSVGFVLSQRGPWELNGQAVKQGQGVPRGARIVLANTATFGAGETYSIVVILLNNKDASLTCAAVETCRPGLVVPSSLTEQASLGSRLVDVFQLILYRPEHYVGLLSRGDAADAPSFADGVAKLADGRVLLAPFFASLPDGRYQLRFERAEATEPPSPRQSVDVAWDHTAASASPSAPLAAAVYRVTLTRSTDVSFSPREVWILVEPEPRFTSAAAAFAEATTSSASWPPSVPRRDVTIFLHAYLTSLAARPQ